MKKYVFITVMVIAVFPSITYAAWWNPFTWKQKKVEVTQVVEVVATTTEEALPEVDLSGKPTYEDLMKRIAELEDKLAKALTLAKQDTPTAKKEVPVTVKTVASTSTLSEKEVIAKTKSAVVFVETATSSRGAMLVDSSGRVMVSADTVLILNSNNTVTGSADEIKVTLANGSKKTARILGIDEALNVALYKIIESGTYGYVKPVFDSSLKVGDVVYVASKKNASSEPVFISGTVSRKDTNAIEVLTDSKPLETGGAVLNAKGELVGIPNKASCKVIEEQEKCLKYKFTVNSIRTVFPKLVEGMRLYKDLRGLSKIEQLVRGELEGMYANTNEGVLIKNAVLGVTGDNSFDNFNGKLVDDEGGKITRIYLSKLKIAAERMYKAADFLKNQAYNLNIFFINESSTIEQMGDYQRKILKKIESANLIMLKDYEKKLALWSAKKNEYDGYIADISGVNHDYLMEQGVFVESAAKYFLSEQKKIIDLLSGEVINIF